MFQQKVMKRAFATLGGFALFIPALFGKLHLTIVIMSLLFAIGKHQKKTRSTQARDRVLTD